MERRGTCKIDFTRSYLGVIDGWLQCRNLEPAAPCRDIIVCGHRSIQKRIRPYYVYFSLFIPPRLMVGPWLTNYPFASCRVGMTYQKSLKKIIQGSRCQLARLRLEAAAACFTGSLGASWNWN